MNVVRPVTDILIDLADDSPEPVAFFRFCYTFSKCSLDTTGIENILGGDRVGLVEVDCVKTQLRKDLERYTNCPCTMYSFTLGIVMLFDVCFFTVLGLTAQFAWIVIFSIVVGGTFFILICYGLWRQIRAFHSLRESQLKECLKKCNRFFLARRGAGVYIQRGYEGMDSQIIVLVIFNIAVNLPGNLQELQLQLAEEEQIRERMLHGSISATQVVAELGVPPPLQVIDIEKEPIKIDPTIADNKLPKEGASIAEKKETPPGET